MRLICLTAALLMPTGVLAQPLTCAVPALIERPHPDTPDARQPRRVVPTASYTLALSWGPQYCRERGEASFQCATGNKFGFILHGLWPEGAGREWPQYCRPVELLTDATIRANLCATPSVQLLQHEWAKHGSCMAGSADAYFARATGLYGRLRFPDMDALSRRSGLTVGALTAAMARINPAIAPAMIRVRVTRGGWLDEVWLCHGLDFRPARCTRTNDGTATTTARLRIWRGER
jgi:ribonuclease T2